MTRKEFLINHATQLLTKGLNVIAVDGRKKALFAWKDYTEDRITEKALQDQINNDKATGIAAICGAVSGNLEVIDFDLKYDISGDLFARYNALIPSTLLDKIYIIKTKSGGFHYYYRCEVIEGNQKLAGRRPTPEELKDTPHLKQLVLIETRGNGGYVVAPPTDGYEVINDVDIPILSIDERECLLDIARSFHEVFEEERAKFSSTGTPFVVSPFDEYNAKTDPVALLLRHGWTIDNHTKGKNKVFLKRPGNSKASNSANFHTEKNLFYVWSTSTQFVPGKAYSPSAVFAILEHNGDFSAASRDLIKQGYGTLKTAESVKEALKAPLEVDFKFWEVVETKKGGTKIEVSLTKLVQFIHNKGGFTGYKYSESAENIIVQVKEGFVRKVDVYDIKQFLKNYILSLPDAFDGITPEELLEVVYREYLSYLSKNFFDFLNVTELNFLQDTSIQAYFPFHNGIVEVTKDGFKLYKYGEFNKVIWTSEMIDRNIEIHEDVDFSRVDFCKFIRKASGDNDPKFEYFVSIIGYLLHKYKDPKSAFAVILAEETENEADGGGTGKGLFIKGIKELIPTEIFDGKQFSPGKSFAFQRVSLDTKLIAIEDAKRNFRFEELYGFITEGLPVEKKNQKEFFIPFEDAPKISISTNYVISDEGNHAKRRQKVLEFSNYFSPSRTPFDEFGRMFFKGWDSDEWNRFYNFMFYCCQVYLENGILEADQSDTNKIKNIKIKYGEDLLLFFDSLAVKSNDHRPIRDLYNEFILGYGLTPKDYDKRKFTAGLRYIASVKGYKLEDSVKKIEGHVHKTMLLSPQTKDAA